MSKVLLLLLLITTASGCGMGQLFGEAPPTPTPTVTPAPTATPVPTATAVPGESSSPAAIATPLVTIPSDFTTVVDERLGYSFAVPGSWSELDLRSTQVQRLAGFLGMGEQLTPLNRFLDSPEGQVVGKIYITDITSAMFGGLPSLLNVSVFDAPDLTAETAAAYVQEQIDANIGTVGGKTTVSPVNAKVINNLPALEASATVDLASFGINNQAYARVVALLANDQIYLLTIFVPADQRESKAAILDQIVGTFRPE